MPQKKMKQGNQATLAQRILNLDDYDLAKTIADDARACYPIDQPSKSLQIEAVMHLVRLKNTFVMAGTGFGKSRVPELYVHLFAKLSKPVVLVLNPLDTLGNNQVREKIAQKSSPSDFLDTTALIELRSLRVDGHPVSDGFCARMIAWDIGGHRV
ncbi:hypothetical protein PCANC_21361 [Puccinia coronata f. sp. avenae]|uniref:DEAD/DEAH box helicase domain-containing protein n=1 Tax=Puccinia coronata f. sp. avenae TaxID=200324 RepID=A0A2N5SA86_9BASI|nr:hypothetical protein PCANC_21361 [Puccinia coronata f. sp. avenae]